jgi:hypothetical protein
MNKPITITATLPAWLPSYTSVDDLMAAVLKGNTARVVDMPMYTITNMGKGSDPYTLIGEAEITLTLKPRDELVTAQVAALQRELQAERAESMRKQNAIMDRISKLQALTFEGEVTA